MEPTTLTIVISIGALIVALVFGSFGLFFSSRNSHKNDVEKETTAVAAQAAGQARLEVMLKQVQETGVDTIHSLKDLKEDFSHTRETIIQLEMRQKANFERLDKHNGQINDLFDLVRTLDEKLDKVVQCYELQKKGGNNGC